MRAEGSNTSHNRQLKRITTLGCEAVLLSFFLTYYTKYIIYTSKCARARVANGLPGVKSV